MDQQSRRQRAAYYREQADLAEADARAAKVSEAADAFRRIAAEWRRLAEQAEDQR